MKRRRELGSVETETLVDAMVYFFDFLGYKREAFMNGPPKDLIYGQVTD